VSSVLRNQNGLTSYYLQILLKFLLDQQFILIQPITQEFSFFHFQTGKYWLNWIGDFVAGILKYHDLKLDHVFSQGEERLKTTRHVNHTND